MIFQTLYELGTSGLVYSTCYNQFLMILHHPWFRVNNKKCKKVKKLIFWKSKLNEDFLRPYMSWELQGWFTRHYNQYFCNKIKIDRFHPKPWFLKMHHIYMYKNARYRSHFWTYFHEIHMVGAGPLMDEPYCFWK